jgi:hypothetical protein
MVVFLRGALVQIKMRRPQEQTLDQEARDQTGKICANKILAFAMGNNVGVEIAKTPFRINGLWALVRSEGDRIYCDINELARFVKQKGAFQI